MFWESIPRFRENSHGVLEHYQDFLGCACCIESILELFSNIVKSYNFDGASLVNKFSSASDA